MVKDHAATWCIVKPQNQDGVGLVRRTSRPPVTTLVDGLEVRRTPEMEVRRTLQTSDDKARATKNSKARRRTVTGKSANAGYGLSTLRVVLATFRGRRSPALPRNSTFLAGNSSVPARNVARDSNLCGTTRPRAHGIGHPPHTPRKREFPGSGNLRRWWIKSGVG